MPKFIKYIIGLCCAVLLTYTSARADEKVFDVIDANTSHAVMKQTPHNDTRHLSSASQHKKECSLLADHKHGKKYRGGKHVSFAFYFKLPEQPLAALPHPSLVLTPKIPKHYKYLFCKEINPPPPKSC